MKIKLNNSMCDGKHQHGITDSIMFEPIETPVDCLHLKFVPGLCYMLYYAECSQ